MKKSIFLTVLRNYRFLKVWLIQVLSLTTAYMLNFVLIDRIFSATNSSVAVSLFLAFYVLPTVILGPFVGVLIDLIDKRQILFFSNFLQGFIVLLYLLIGQNIWPIYSIVLLYSFCDEFFNPCIGAMIPSLVKKRELPTANSFFFLTTQGSLILGLTLGGILLRFLNFWFIFPFASVLLFLAALLARTMPKEKEHRDRSEIRASLADLWEQLREGYNFIREEPRVFLPMIFLGGLQMLLGMGTILLPPASKTILKISFADSPFYFIIPALVGAIAGSLLLERKAKDYRKKVFITRGLFSLAGGLMAFSLIPSFLPQPLFLGTLVAIILGFSFVLIYIPLQTLIQEHTPFSVRGRVFTILTTIITLAAALPFLATATLIDLLGIRLILALVGFSLVVLAIYIKKGIYGLIPANHRA